MSACSIAKLAMASPDTVHALQHAKQLADTVREKVRNIGFERHKLVVQVSSHCSFAAILLGQGWAVHATALQVTLAQKKGQALRIASRCLWDASNDTYTSCVYENESLVCNCQAGAPGNEDAAVCMLA